ncbi:MAG: hypothetical protein HQL14_07485 [Candidatus Omnitrophica bacterium]|nr:hypothetical protein [Candidatus Omnitrophota bacterium]
MCNCVKDVILSVLFIAAMSLPNMGVCEERLVSPKNSIKNDLPFYDEIMQMIQSLEYSGLPVMVKPQVKLGVDFSARTWTLQNIHEYDKQGGIVLEQGRYGLCAELATYLYEKIKPLLDARFEVKFARVTEAGFFSADRSNHIVLIMANHAIHEAYLIDPSFHKYAKLKDLPEYHVLDIQDALVFVKDKSPDVSFSVDQATPLYVRGDILLSFAVTSVDGKFDRDNFLFVISANRRFKYSSLDILVVGRHNKKFEDFEYKDFLEQLLNPEEIRILEDKFNSWLKLMG